MRTIIAVCLFLLSVMPASARNVAGVTVAETVEGASGVTLSLNGAGIRSKLFFKIYIAELYLENPAAEASTIIADEGQKRMVMHFLYDEVSKDKLVAAWDDGFKGNLSEQKRMELASKIDEFNQMFATVKKGDNIVLDYVPGTGTQVIVADQNKGFVEGKDFSDALFAIWLGEKPVTKDLKKALLAYNK